MINYTNKKEIISLIFPLLHLIMSKYHLTEKYNLPTRAILFDKVIMNIAATSKTNFYNDL